MCERWLLKENAKKSLKHYFWSAVLAIVITAAIMVVIGRISGVPEISIRLNPYGSAGYSTELPGYGYATIRGVLGILLSILVGYPISVGLIRFFILNRKESAGLGELFFSFKNGTFANVALITLCQSVFVFLAAADRSGNHQIV